MKGEADIKQMSESFLIGGILAFAGGFFDIYTYMTRGGVFANAQTGNMVLFGINIYEGNYFTAVRYMIPVIAFALGIQIAEFIRSGDEKRNIHWRQIILFYEIILITAVGFVPNGNHRTDTAVNIIISFVCSLQVESFRKLDGNAYSTTMCTGNLRSGSEALYRFIRLKDMNFLKKSLEYYAVIVIFVIGAIFGAYITKILLYRSIWICTALLLSVFVLMFIKRE